MAISFSQLQTYRRCPKQYEFATVKKIPRRISAGESFGSSIHNTLKRWGELELQVCSPQTEKNQLTLFTGSDESESHRALELITLLTIFRECFIAEGYEHRAARDAALLRGEAVLKDFFAWWSKASRNVVSIESGFTFTVPKRNADEASIEVAGRFDRIEQDDVGLLIIDYKTGTARSQESVDNDLQLSIYALAAAETFRKPVSELILLFLTEEGLIERTTTRSASQLKDAMTAIRLLSEGIDQKDFKATPSREKCRYCPYRDICTMRAV